MNKKEKLDEAEKALFREAMRGVKPIIHKSSAPPHQPPIKFKKRKPEEEQPLSPLSDYETLPLVTSEDAIEFKQPDVSYKILRKLRRGQYNMEAALDLHGMNATEARESLYCFILACQKKNVRNVLIIHGKGRNNKQPILKNKLNHWLRQLKQVLAFCSAAAKDGRSGALYVLLKNSSGEKIS